MKTFVVTENGKETTCIVGKSIKVGKDFKTISKEEIKENLKKG